MTEELTQEAPALPRHRVHFSTELVTHFADDYDRTAVESDIFSCDICNIQIPAGIKGFEPYGTCEVCEDGFDAFGACCGTEALMRICHSTATNSKATIRVRCHEHILKVVDRKAEIMWANDTCVGQDAEETKSNSSLKKKEKKSPAKKSGVKRPRSPRNTSKSPRKKTKL